MVTQPSGGTHTQWMNWTTNGNYPAYQFPYQFFTTPLQTATKTNQHETIVDAMDIENEYDDQNSSDEENVASQDEEMNDDEDNNKDTITRKFFDPWNFGGPTCVCRHCGAIMWYEERTIRSKRPLNPKFSLCCQDGNVKLPLLKETPRFLKQLLDYNGGPRSTKFRENIRLYNMMFAFTSMGGKINRKINNGGEPYVFKLGGQNHYKIGSLLPIPETKPKFAQLYNYDTQNEVDNIINALSEANKSRTLDREVIEGLVKMLDKESDLIKVFRMARDRFKESKFVSVRLRLIRTRNRDARQYNLPTTSKVATLIVDNIFEHNRGRDAVVDKVGQGLQRIHHLQPSFMVLQYLLLFPHGEDGYSAAIERSQVPGTRTSKRKRIIMREFYVFRIQQRENEGHTVILSDHLFKQYLVDLYECKEEDMFSYIRSNQNKIRSELYQNLKDVITAGDTTPTSVGKRVVLPSTFTGEPRYMVQNYQDALAICRFTGSPDLFITFTCNQKWSEIEEFTEKIGQKAENRDEIVAWAFKIKLNELMDDLFKRKQFGKVW